MKIYICNAFSLSMLNADAQRANPHYGSVQNGMVVWPRIPCPVGDSVAVWLENAVRHGAEVESAVGHADTAALFAALLGIEVPVRQVAIKLDVKGETRALIGQLAGPDGGPVRLPEGATTLPEGATIQWWIV